ncbi:MAG: hypothetical protein ABMB14_24620 [Myxococcota bacterium]
MGHGPARELAGPESNVVELDPGLAAILDTALDKLDRVDPKFKATRDEERYAQTTKAWHRSCAELDAHLRLVGKVLFTSHQLNLDIGSEGGGVKARPWIDEMNKVFERLWFVLEGTEVVATSGGATIARAKLKDVSYGWVERAVVDWVVGVVAKK